MMREIVSTRGVMNGQDDHFAFWVHFHVIFINKAGHGGRPIPDPASCSSFTFHANDGIRVVLKCSSDNCIFVPGQRAPNELTLLELVIQAFAATPHI